MTIFALTKQYLETIILSHKYIKSLLIAFFFNLYQLSNRKNIIFHRFIIPKISTRFLLSILNYYKKIKIVYTLIFLVERKSTSNQLIIEI